MLRLLACMVLAVALMVLDHRSHWLQSVRSQLESAMQPLWWAAGLPSRLGAAVRSDAVTSAQLSEDNRRLRQALLVASARNAAGEVAIVALNSEGRYFLFNAGAERLFGYRAEEFIGRDAPMLDRVGDFAPTLMAPGGFAAMAAQWKERGGAAMTEDWRLLRALVNRAIGWIDRSHRPT